MAKKLTVNEIKKLSKQMDEQKEVLILDGEYKVMIDKQFKVSKIQKVIADIQKAMVEMKVDGVNTEKFGDLMVLNFMFVFKHFTNLDLPEDYKDLLVVSEYLMDIGAFEGILNAFDQKEIDKLVNSMKTVSENLPKMEELFKVGNDTPTQ